MASAKTSVSEKTDSTGSPQKKKFGLVLQGGGALGAYEAGAIKCLYERGMECTIVAGASSGAFNCGGTRRGEDLPAGRARSYVDRVRDPEVSATGSDRALLGVIRSSSHVQPRLDYWKLPIWTYLSDNTPLKGTLERLDWDQVRDPAHMRLLVSASDIENVETVYFSNLPPEKLPGPDYPAVLFGVEHVLASSSFPGGFPGTVIDGRAT